MNISFNEIITIIEIPYVDNHNFFLANCQRKREVYRRKWKIIYNKIIHKLNKILQWNMLVKKALKLEKHKMYKETHTKLAKKRKRHANCNKKYRDLPVN